MAGALSAARLVLSMEVQLTKGENLGARLTFQRYPLTAVEKKSLCTFLKNVWINNDKGTLAALCLMSPHS